MEERFVSTFDTVLDTLLFFGWYQGVDRRSARRA
jgi:hypothetical protein